MKQKQFTLLVIFLLGFRLIGLHAQTIYLKEKSGNKTAYDFNYIRKITFLNGNATIHKVDNSEYVYSLSGIRYLNFTDLTTVIVNPEIQSINSGFLVYPNPMRDLLYIDLTEENEKGTISILTLEGREIQTQKIEGNGLVIINLSHLSRGIYLCRVTNEKGFKIVKIIKQ